VKYRGTGAHEELTSVYNKRLINIEYAQIKVSLNKCMLMRGYFTVVVSSATIDCYRSSILMPQLEGCIACIELRLSVSSSKAT